MNLIIENTQIIEIPVVAMTAGGSVQFPANIAIMDGKRTYGIMCHAGDVDYKYSMNGQAILLTAEILQATLVLYMGGKTPVVNLPLYTLLAPNNGGMIRQFSDMPLEISKCYVVFNSIATDPSNHTLAFTFIYH